MDIFDMTIELRLNFYMNIFEGLLVCTDIGVHIVETVDMFEGRCEEFGRLIR